MKNKKNFYYSVIFITFISIVLFVFAIKNYNKKFDKTLLSTTETLYQNYLEENLKNSFICECKFKQTTEDLNKLISEENMNTYVFPFKIKFIESNEIKIEFDSNEETLLVKFTSDLLSLTKLLKFIKNLGINKNNLNNESNQDALTDFINHKYFNILSEISYYRFINIYLLYDIKDDNYDFNIQELTNKLTLQNISVYVKKLFYDPKALNNNDFYDSISSLNSHITLEELQDDKIFKLILKKNNDQNRDKSKNLSLISINKLNLDIFELGESDLPNYDINDLISIRLILRNQFISDEFKKNLTYEWVKIMNTLLLSKRVNFHFNLLKGVHNLKKFNEIFNFYNSIKNHEDVYNLYKILKESLEKVVLSKFSLKSFENSSTFYGLSNYLMQSSMVQYDHYFSFEFKIGTFLPMMLPLIYGFFKVIRAIKNYIPKKKIG